jgi:hypothetical protein
MGPREAESSHDYRELPEKAADASPPQNGALPMIFERYDEFEKKGASGTSRASGRCF